MPRHPPPDIVLFAAAWNPRALLRAQLIEEGFTVIATDTWEMMRRELRPGVKPRLAIVDLQDLEDPLQVLRDLGILMKPDRALIVTALGTVAPADIKARGFRVAVRPLTIRDIVAMAAAAVREAEPAQRGHDDLY